MANPVTLDIEPIAARFYLTNKAISDVKSGGQTLNFLATEQSSPTAQEITNAIGAIKSSATQVSGLPTCTPCTINGQGYYGLTPSQCSAMGGTCITLDSSKKP
jgi:hypothetical protein